MVVTRSQSRSSEPSLPKDLVAVIAEVLLSGDLTDFVCFRAVCKDWRLFTDHLKSRADVFIPRDWMLLSVSISQPHQFEFFNTASGKFFSASVPLSLLRQGYSLHSTVNCFLFLEKKTETKTKRKRNGYQPCTMALLNLFTGFFTELPPILVSTCGRPVVPFPNTLDGGYANSKGTLFFWEKYSSHSHLVWKKQGCNTWFYNDFGIYCSNYFLDNGCLYGVDSDKGLVRVNLLSADEVAAVIDFEVLASCPRMYPDEVVESASVFNCRGTIVVVLFLNDDSGEYQSYEKFDVCKFNTETRRFVAAEDINDNAIFISREKSLAVSCKNLVGVHANSVAFCGLISDDVVRYDVSQNMEKSYSPRPNTIAGDLVKYCFDGWDEDNMEIE